LKTLRFLIRAKIKTQIWHSPRPDMKSNP